jgi:Hypothetical protein (DUF2513)
MMDSSGVMAFPTRLTWDGHEFLDAARDDTRWQKAKRYIVEKGSGLSFEVLQGVLMKLMTDALAGPHP